MLSVLSQSCAIPVGSASVAAVAWRFKGELRMTAIVKATFALAPDATMPRIEPQPIFRDDVHHAKNQMRSLVFASDLVPFKRRADVLFTGYAYAPGGSARSASVRLAVASGDRVLLDKTIQVRKAGAFDRIPLLYEHALGGLGHPENPYGEERESDDLHLFDPADPERVAGLGPLSPAMGARARRRGPAPLPAFGASPVQIPEAFDFDFFQAAPADQQIAYLRGDEWVLLEGLHPTLPRVCTCLPGARAVARIHGLSQHGLPEGQPLGLSADGLHVSGEEGRCSLTWRGTFVLPNEAALGAARIAAGVEVPGEPVTWPDAAEIARYAAAPPRVASNPGVAIPGLSSADATIAISESDVVSASSAAPNATLAIDSSVQRPSSRLPFRAPDPGAQPAIAARAPAPRSRAVGGETLPIASTPAPRPAPLPFRIPGAAPADPPRPAPVAPAVVATPALAKEAPPTPVAAALPEPEAPAKKPVVEAPEVIVVRAPERAPKPAPAPRPVPKRLPPKVDISNKLYGTKKQG